MLAGGAEMGDPSPGSALCIGPSPGPQKLIADSQRVILGAQKKRPQVGSS
jgi:hypothetical protein